MPSYTTVMKWRREIPEFAQIYAYARESMADYLFDETLDIADDGSRDYKAETDDNGGSRYVVDHDHISRSRLRVDTRKFYIAKVAPKKYGDKVTQQNQQLDANGDPTNPVPTLGDFYQTVRRISVDGD